MRAWDIRAHARLCGLRKRRHLCEHPRDVLLRGLDRVIASCNECHAATQHAVIQITRGTEVNPFNQSFRPLPPPAP